MARRRRTKRWRHHRGLSILYKLLSAIVISAAIVAAFIMFFKVENISVSGVTQYSSDQIIKASGVEVGDNMFLLNKYEIYDAIIEKLPYVSSVSISRKLPDELMIEVTESNQGGVIQYKNEYWVISSKGKLLGKRTEAGNGARILGIQMKRPTVGEFIEPAKGSERRVSQMQDLLAALDSKGMLQGVTCLDFQQDSVISMDYAERYQVKFLYGADFEYKLSQLSFVIEKLGEQGDIRNGVIDLTHEGRANFIPE